MFEAKFGKAALLRKVVEALKDLVSDAPFDCAENAMTLQAMDSSHVALVTMRLGNGIFDIYRCDRTINLGLSIPQVTRALKCAGNDDSCTIRYDDDENDSMLFSFLDEKNHRKQDVTVKLLDIDAEHLGVPDTKYTATLEMSANDFRKVVTDLAMFGDTMVITVMKGSVTFETSGENGGNVVTFQSDDECRAMDDDDEEEETGKKSEEDRRVLLTCTEKVKLAFSIKYLVHFSKATVLSSRVRLCMSSKVPVVVEYKIEDDGFVKFYLAPKIDEDQDMDD